MQMAPQEVRAFFVGAVTWGRRPIFRAEPMARLFLDTLRNYRVERRYFLHEFVLMPEHFQLLLTPAPDISLEKAVQFIKGGFSSYTHAPAGTFRPECADSMSPFQAVELFPNKHCCPPLTALCSDPPLSVKSSH